MGKILRVEALHFSRFARENAMCKKEKISASISAEIKIRDNMRCRGCGGGFLSKNDLECDHIMPESAGGKTDCDNLQALCKHCNIAKSDVVDPIGWALPIWPEITDETFAREGRQVESRQAKFKGRVQQAKARAMLYWRCLRQTWTESKHDWNGRKSAKISKLSAHKRIAKMKGEKYAEKIRKMVAV